VYVVKCTGLYKLPKHNLITFAGMAVRPQVMPDLLPQQSSGGSPVTGMTRLNSTEDAKQKPFMSCIHTLRPVNVETEGSTQVAPMCASCVLPKKIGKIV